MVLTPGVGGLLRRMLARAMLGREARGLPGSVPWGDVEITDGTDAVKAVLEGCEGGGLRQEHEEAVKAFVEVGVAFWFEQLKSEICEERDQQLREKRGRATTLTGEDWRLEKLDELVDLDEHVHCHLQFAADTVNYQ